MATTTPKTVLVTGANQGLGFAIVSTAAARDPSASYILTCRNSSAGSKVIDELKKTGITANLELVQLDVTKDTDILQAVEWVKTKHGKLDGMLNFLNKNSTNSSEVLIKNAGIVEIPDETSLPALRAAYNDMFNVNV
jgi:NAD(P)-dependent dehydrogenase (short-subunit alcohol dehydrogenase family)